MELLLNFPMPQQYSFVGQRADKMSITGLSEVDGDHDGHVIRGTGIAKEIEHYTVTCDECREDGEGGVGRYDDKGDIICEDCGMVLSGGRQAQLPVDYSGSRGYAEEDGDHPMGVVEPSV